ESSDAEIREWVKTTFNEPDSMCYAVKAATDKWVNAILAEGQKNPNLLWGHWEIVHLAGDFHPGWNAALRELEETYCDVVTNDDFPRQRTDFKAWLEITGSRDRAI